MNPSAPVTRTGTPRSDSGTVAALARPRELLAMPYVDPVVFDLEGAHAIAAREEIADQVRRVESSAVDEVQHHGVERVDPAVDLARESRLLVQPDDAIALPFDAPEGDRVEIAPNADRRDVARLD